MQRAAHALRTTDEAVAQIGVAVGYPVETTFNSTFKRVIGDAPGRYRRAFRTRTVSGSGLCAGA
jgi:transcriptional regulator GlxA family with amidase domain